MNCRVLAAGWPFAGLLALEANRGGGVSESTQRSGVIARDDGGSGILVYGSDDAFTSVELPHTAAVFGVDGYPISLADLAAGDAVQVIQAQSGSRWVTAEVRVVRRGSERSAPAWVAQPVA